MAQCVYLAITSSRIKLEIWDLDHLNLTSHSIFSHIWMIYRMAGNFRGVLIFVIFVVGSAVTKITTHEN